MSEDAQHEYIWDKSPARLEGEPMPVLPDVATFIEGIKEEVPDLLPPWWTDEKARECAEYCARTGDEFKW